jgi:hypothetical protein
MPRVVFTSNLRRHIDCPEASLEAETVREALEAVFAENPALRSYIVDDQMRLRTHMVLRDPRDGYRYLALDHGHFGTKLHRSSGDGTTWEEIAVPVFPCFRNSRTKIGSSRLTPANGGRNAIFRRCTKSGNSRRAVLINRVCYGRAQFQVGCFVPAIAVRRGN